MWRLLRGRAGGPGNWCCQLTKGAFVVRLSGVNGFGGVIWLRVVVCCLMLTCVCNVATTVTDYDLFVRWVCCFPCLMLVVNKGSPLVVYGARTA